MRIILETVPPCRCSDKLAALQAERDLYLGSVVECDCGQMYILAEHQFEGRYWAKYSPDRNV